MVLRAEIRENPDFVKKLDSFLRGRQAELLGEARRIVADMVEAIRVRWTGDSWKGLVVIVDSLDHNRAIETENFNDVRRALANLFDLDRDKLILPSCRMVFTLPSYVRATGAGARYLTNVKVLEREGNPYAPGVDALREILRKRVPGRALDRLFADDALVEQLILASGGHLRMLLGLAVELITQAEVLPVDMPTVESSIQQVRNTLLPIPFDQLALLRTVSDTQQLPLGSEDEWHIVAELLNERLVLGYQNGEPWYCVHPLLRDRVDRDREEDATTRT